MNMSPANASSEGLRGTVRPMVLLIDGMVSVVVRTIASLTVEPMGAKASAVAKENASSSRRMRQIPARSVRRSSGRNAKKGKRPPHDVTRSWRNANAGRKNANTRRNAADARNTRSLVAKSAKGRMSLAVAKSAREKMSARGKMSLAVAEIAREKMRSVRR